jgi:hypothetical protein
VVVRRAIVLFAVAACGNDQRPPLIDEVDQEARATYPDLESLYQGDHGIYRGCGPNGGVCHNGNEFPNLDSMGSIVANIDIACNQKRDNGLELDDLCERRGDRVEIGGQKIEIAYLEPYDNNPTLAWRLVLREPPAVLPPADPMQVWRAVPDGVGGSIDVPFLPLSAAFIGYIDDPMEPSGRAILFGMHQGAEVQQIVLGFLQQSGLTRPDRLLYGDPNRNGTFGADLGGRLIKPGDPQKSYLLRRLTDPTMGPLMPRANCCSWTKASLRALWCWVDGLLPDASNATAPIDYDRCRSSPPVELLYPIPGESCEAQGLCPVEAVGGTGEPTFSSIYAEILTRRCAGQGCHDTEAPGGVDLRSVTAAYETLADRVVPGDPDASALVRRLTPALCESPCKTMPLDRPPLVAADVERIREWILRGAVDD